MADPVFPDYPPALDGNGDPLSGGRIRFYLSGTTILATVYSNQDGTDVIASSEVDLDGAGRSIPVYQPPGVVLKSVIYDADGAIVRIVDPLLRGAGTGSDASSIGFTAIVGNAADDVQAAIASNTQRLEDLGTPGTVGLDLLGAGTTTEARTALGLGTAATVDVIDEDSFATDSATRPPSQQSVKAYHAANTALTKGYASAAQTITSAGTITLTHGLGGIPKLLSYFLTCVTDEAGYTAGEVIAVDFGATSTGATRFNTSRVTATTVVIRYSDEAACFVVGHRGTGVATALTNTNWTLTVRAFA